MTRAPTLAGPRVLFLVTLFLGPGGFAVAARDASRLGRPRRALGLVVGGLLLTFAVAAGLAATPATDEGRAGAFLFLFAAFLAAALVLRRLARADVARLAREGDPPRPASPYAAALLAFGADLAFAVVAVAAQNFLRMAS